MEIPPAKGRAQLRILGLGLPRTGTASLQLALEHLGYSPCHHMQKNVVMERFPYSSGRTWRRIFAEQSKEKRQALMRDIYEGGGFKAAVDFPTCAFAEDLLEMYPNAKFILSVRKTPESWRTSWNNSLDITKSTWFATLTYLMPSSRISLQPLMSAWDDRNAAQYDGARAYRNESVDLYERHNAWVKKVVPSDKLLVHEASEGWEPLCRFIGVDVPDLPYPRVNDTKAMKNGFYIGATVGTLVWLISGTILVWMWRNMTVSF